MNQRKTGSNSEKPFEKPITIKICDKKGYAIAFTIKKNIKFQIIMDKFCNLTGYPKNSFRFFLENKEIKGIDTIVGFRLRHGNVIIAHLVQKNNKKI